MRTIDISLPIEDGMAGFPGDPPVEVRKVRSLERGDRYDLSQLSMGTHSGTHVDPPSHFLRGRPTVDALDFTVLNGPCSVVRTLSGVREVGPEDVARLPAGTVRALFRTRNSEQYAAGRPMDPEFVAVGLEAASALLDRGVKLVGIDGPSVDRANSKAFPVHRALLGTGVILIEGLQLSEAPEGPYELRCLPLRVAAGDGAPCRAVLVAPDL
jgi:arylformamidase